MKTVISLLILSLSFGLLQAQDSNTKRADKHFDRYEFVDAIEDYEKLIQKGEATDYVYQQLAKATYNIYDTKNAERYYARVVEQDGASAESKFRYAQMLKANGKYDESNNWMREFAEQAPNDNRAKAFMENPNYIPKLLNREEAFTLTPMSLNSEYSDFGGTVYGKTMYFVSARNTSRRTYGWNEQPTLDIYQATNVGGTYTDVEPIDGEVNTKYNEGSVAVSNDGNTLYFTRNQFFDGKYGKDKEGVGQLQLYYATKVNNEWKGVKSAPFNNSEYSVGHPTLSKDGETLYFVSDMPGGEGESDLYRVSVSDSGFGTPENLGAAINTPGKENFPYVDEDGTLFFSSNGHLGLGGLDVFYSREDNGGFSEPKSVGLPVNSSGDDYAFTMNLETGEGFVSSNRDENLVDNIYEVRQIEPLCEVIIAVTVTDSNSSVPISGARVEIFDADQNRISSVTSNENGEAQFTVDCETDYAVQANATDYESNAENINSANEDRLNVSVSLNPIEEIVEEDVVVLEPIYFEYDKSNITSKAAFELDKLVGLMKKYPEMVIVVRGHTDNNGGDAYNQRLSERRAKSTVQYVISKGIEPSRISSESFGESKPAVPCGDDCSDKQDQLNRRSEFVIVRK